MESEEKKTKKKSILVLSSFYVGLNSMDMPF